MKDEALKLAQPAQAQGPYSAPVKELWSVAPKAAAQPAPVQPVQEPEIVQRVKRYAGQTMRTARNPNITARECIELANWIVATPPAAQPAVPDALNPKDENPAYAAGWNDCRQAMLEMMK